MSMKCHLLRIATLLSSLCVTCHCLAQNEESRHDEAPLLDSFEGVANHKGSQLRFTQQDTAEHTRIRCDITSDRGIDRAVIDRKAPQWPNQMVLRLHLKGLESLKVTCQQTTITWSISSTGDHSARTYRTIGDREQEIIESDPLYAKIKLVGDSTIPLKNGYFELVLPQALFAGNPESIKCEWIDFYRR
jgi:hypothetical protein